MHFLNSFCIKNYAPNIEFDKIIMPHSNLLLVNATIMLKELRIMWIIFDMCWFEVKGIIYVIMVQ